MNSGPAPDAAFGAILDELKGLTPSQDADRMAGLLRRLLALADRKAKPLQWAGVNAQLGTALMNCVTGDRAANRDEAIARFEDALTVFEPVQAFAWTNCHYQLGELYLRRRNGAPAANLELAANHYDECLKVCEAPETAWLAPSAHYGAGLAYLNRVEGARAANIERAIVELETAARSLSPDDTREEWIDALIKLGGAYRQREVGDPAENIEMAFAIYAAALQVCTRETDPMVWARLQNLMGGAWLTRLTTKFEDNVEQAIACHSSALTAIDRGLHPIEWSDTQRQLGDALQVRVYGDASENVETAIACYRYALEVCGPDRAPESYALALANLAGALGKRKLGKRTDNLRDAIGHLEAAQEVFLQDPLRARWAAAEGKLGSAFAELSSEGDQAALDQVERHCRQALEALPPGSDPAERRRIWSILANALFRARRWPQAQHAFEWTIDEGELLAKSAYTPAGMQEAVWHLAGLYPLRAWCQLKQGHPGEALETLEMAKLRGLAPSFDDEIIDRTERKSAGEFRATRDAVDRLEAEARLAPATPGRRDDRTLARLMSDAREAFNIATSRLRDRNPEVLPPHLDVEVIRSLVPTGGALAFPILTDDGSATLLLSAVGQKPGEVDVVPHESFTREDALQLLRGRLESGELGGWLGDYSFQRSQPDRWLRAIEEIGGVLWDRMFRAIHERLQQLGLAEGSPLVLLLQGGLGVLPVHLAWRLAGGVKRYLLDDYTISYSPSAAALLVSNLRLRYRQKRLGRSLSAIVNPTGDLPLAGVEAAFIAQRFPGNSADLLRNAASASTASLSGSCYLHFCCHGDYDWNDQLNAGLSLAGGGRLTIAQVLGEVRLPDSRLVTLSACETGLFKVTSSPDEFIGLPSAFLRAGAPGVVSSLWRVADISTTFLMDCFYQRHLENGLQPAGALREAQRWLRDAPAAELASQLRNSAAAEWESASAAWRSLVARDAGEKPFAHPFYWGAFTVTGA